MYNILSEFINKSKISLAASKETKLKDKLQDEVETEDSKIVPVQYCDETLQIIEPTKLEGKICLICSKLISI